ncbi:MAG: 50S ribosomal protein L25 [Acidimicrobiales bacterium]
MAEVKLRAEAGRQIGSRGSRRLRTEEKIPGVLYGHGIDPLSVAVQRRDLRLALTTDAGMNALIDLEVDGAQHLAIVRDVQRDPVRNRVTHVDFILVNRDEVITVEVPVVVTGASEQVRREGGTVDQVVFNLTVSAIPGRIPNEFNVDVSGMDIGDTIRVGDLDMPSEVTTEVDAEEPVVIAQVSRTTMEADELAAEAEAEAEAEAAESATGGGAGEERGRH